MKNGNRKQFVVFALLVFLVSCQSASPPIMGNQSFALSGIEISELEQSANGGNAEAAMKLANYYGYFRGDQHKEIYWLRIGADAGSVACQTSLATLLLVLREPESKEEAIHYLHMAADAGDADAQFVLGEIYEQGEGVAIDHCEE